MDFPASWLDKNKLVIPQPHSDHSDNGVLFTSVAVLRGYNIPTYVGLVEGCFLENGLMARWPKNNFDQAAWDDYLGVAAASIKINNVSLPRSIFWYGVRHLGIYDTDGKLSSHDFLWRNVPVWPLMFAAAYPKIKYLMYPFLWLVQRFFKSPAHLISVNDTSGFQLQWVFLKGCMLLGFTFEKFWEHEALLGEAFLIYYHKEHPFNKEP